MPKKPVTLDGLLNPDTGPIETGRTPRGAGPSESGKTNPARKREGARRVTLALDGSTYRRLRIYAAQTDQTHQAILESALAEYLNRAHA